MDHGNNQLPKQAGIHLQQIIKHELLHDGKTPSLLTKEEYEDYNRAEDIKDRSQDRGLKKSVKRWIFGILAGQTAAMFVLVFLNGFHYKGFYINDTVFGVFITGMIAQTYLIIQIIVSHLFPHKH
jgi:hypothetical protein